MVALWGVLILMGPGIITSNVDNDAGGITTYSLAGAEFGLSMLWSLIPITVVLFIVQEMGARMGVVSGKGLSDLIRERFGVKLTFYLMILLVLTNLGNTLAEFAGIAASLEIFGLSRYLTVPLSILFLMWLAVKGTYKSVEKVFLTACLFYVSYVVTGFLVRPDWLEVVSSVAAPTLRTDSAFLVMLVGLVGTTIAPWMQFYLQASVVDKGLASKDLGAVRLDVIIGSIVVSVVAFFIILACAATLFKLRSHCGRWQDPIAPGFLPSVSLLLLCSQPRFCPCRPHIQFAKPSAGNPVWIRSFLRPPSFTAFTVLRSFSRVSLS
jgi:NRAMP (natural resistance-associated macrophage protein)-like metal ion transporter